MFPAATRVLIVDDSSSARRLLATALRGMGFSRIDEAGGGKAAVDLVTKAAASGDPHGFAIFDLRMPGMDGLELLRFVRLASPNPGLPVLILSAEGDAASALSAGQSGADAFLMKPVDAEKLRERLASMHARRASGG